MNMRVQHQQHENGSHSPPPFNKTSSNASTASVTTSSSSRSASASSSSTPSSSESSNAMRRRLPPPPRVKRSTAAANSTPPRRGSPTTTLSTLGVSQEHMLVSTPPPKASPPPPPRLRRLAVNNCSDENIVAAPLLKTPARQHRQRQRQHEGEIRALLSNSQDYEVDDNGDSNIYTQLEQFGQKLDDELQDLEMLGVNHDNTSYEQQVDPNGGNMNTSPYRGNSEQLKTPKKRAPLFQPSPTNSSASYSSNYSTPERSTCYTNNSTPSKYYSPSSPSRLSNMLPISPPKFKRLSRCGESVVSSPAQAPPSNRNETKNMLSDASSLSFSHSTISTSNNNSQNKSHNAINSQGMSGQSDFSSATVQAAIAARLDAKDQYEMKKLRMQTLLAGQQQQQNQNQNRKKMNIVPRRGESSTTVSNNGTSNIVSRRGASVLQSSPKNNQPQSQSQQEYEILIHPSSINGTTAAAAWHLHGQAGGRRVQDGGENYSVMNAHAITNDSLKDTNGDSCHVSQSESWEEELQSSKINCDGATNVRMDVEEGITTLSATRYNTNSNSNSTTGILPTNDQWSTGIAAAIVTGTASRYHKSFFMFPHGRRILLPIIMGALATALSLVTLLSCQFMTILSNQHSNSNDEEEKGGGSVVYGAHQVFQVGPWRYLSINPSYSDGEVCLPYPSDMSMDTSFLVARSTSALSSCFGCALVLWTLTLMCVPASKGSMNTLGVCFVLNGVMQLLTAIIYQSDNCKSTNEEDGTGGGYFGGGECRPNQDLVFCIAAAILYLATGWILYISHKFTNGNSNSAASLPGHGNSMEVYTWSSEAKSSNPKKGILRTVEKCWTKIPDGSTLMATVFVEQKRTNASRGGVGGSGCDGKTKTTYSIQTEILPA